MMSKKSKTVLKILAMLPVGDMVMVTGKLISGDVYETEEDVSNFSCLETGGRWKLAALGFRTPREMNENVRLIGFEYIEGSKDLEIGFTLVSDET